MEIPCTISMLPSIKLAPGQCKIFNNPHITSRMKLDKNIISG